MHYRAVLLDVDGTLVDSNDAHAHAWVEALAESGRRVAFLRARPLVGMGAATGRVPPRVCANLMWTGYTLFNDYEFRDFDDLRTVIREHLGDVESKPETERVRVKLPGHYEQPDEVIDCTPLGYAMRFQQESQPRGATVAFLRERGAPL